jgi:Double sensory domain of two-component sensor kinase
VTAGRAGAVAGMDRRQKDRRPWWQLSLFERFSIGVQVAGFVVVLALVVVGLSYRAYVTSAQGLIRHAESENLSGAAHVAQARIEAESRVLTTSSQTLARHPAVRAALQDRTAASMALARRELDQSFEQAGFSLLHLVDRSRTIVHRAAQPGLPVGKAAVWGISEALAGDTLLQTSKEASGGLVIRSMVPVRSSDDSVVGVVMAGTRFDDVFAQRIAKDGAVELAFATPNGVVARSSAKFVMAPAAHQPFIEAALFERRPVLDFDLDRAALRQYVPLKLGDETFVLIVQGDAAQAQAHVVHAAQQALKTSAALLAMAFLASCLFALMLASRLRRVGARAQTLARDITGNDVGTGASGDTAQPAFRSELAVLEQVFDRTALAVARHHEELH